MKRFIIHILGASGAGTTTLGREIARTNGFCHLDTDDYYWLSTAVPYTEPRPEKQRQKMLYKDIKRKKRCVISGSLIGWGDFLIPSFDLVIFIDTPTDIRLSRLAKREALQFGKRIEAGGDMYENHQKFMEWASGYDTSTDDGRNRKNHAAWLSKLKCRVLKLNGAMPPEVMLESIGL